TGIKVGKKFTSLHVLHATAYSVEEEEDVTIGSYTLHYEDGTTQTIPIVNGQDVRGWWKRPGAPEPSRGKVAWEGSNDCVTRMGNPAAGETGAGGLPPAAPLSGRTDPVGSPPPRRAHSGKTPNGEADGRPETLARGLVRPGVDGHRRGTPGARRGRQRERRGM